MSHIKQNNQTIMINEVEHTLQYKKKLLHYKFF